MPTTSSPLYRLQCTDKPLLRAGRLSPSKEIGVRQDQFSVPNKEQTSWNRLASCSRGVEALRASA